MTTPNLSLSELAASQAQPHLTVNSAVRRLDAIVQSACIAQQNAPPVSPADGDRYVVGTAATGEWTGHENAIAAYIGTEWQFFAPQPTWLVGLQSAGALYIYGIGSPAGWTELATGGGGDAASGNITPDTHPTAPDAMDDEFEAGSLDGKWSWRNQGAAAVTFERGCAVLTAVQGSSNSLRILEQTITGNWRVRAKIAVGLGGRNYVYAGLGMIANGTGRAMMICTFDAASDASVNVLKFTDATTYSSSPFNTAGLFRRFGAGGAFIYFEIEHDGTNVIFRASANGVQFDTLYSEAAATFLGTPDRVFIYADDTSNSATVGRCVCDWFRKVA